MKLQATQNYGTDLIKGKWYDIIYGVSHTDGSVCLYLPSMVTATGKAVSSFKVMSERGRERFPPISYFDLSPLQKYKMSKLQELVAKQYFTKSKVKQIASMTIALQKEVSLLQQQLDNKKDLYEKLESAVEYGDIETVEAAIKELGL